MWELEHGASRHMFVCAQTDEKFHCAATGTQKTLLLRPELQTRLNNLRISPDQFV